MTAPAPITGDGDLYGWFDAPGRTAEVAMQVVGADGAIVATAAGPSGGLHLRVAAGTYALRFAVDGVAAPACTAPITVPAGQQALVNSHAPPAGCALWAPIDRTHRMPVHGLPGDVAAIPGAYDGYHVRACDRAGDDILYVQGDGPTPMPTGEAVNAWAEHLRTRIAQALEPMTSGVGFGVACRADAPVGIIVYVSDRRQVDRALARLVEIIRAEQTGAGFTIAIIGEAEAE